MYVSWLSLNKGAVNNSFLFFVKSATVSTHAFQAGSLSWFSGLRVFSLLTSVLVGLLLHVPVSTAHSFPSMIIDTLQSFIYKIF